MPGNDDVGSVNVRLTATDLAGASVDAVFALQVRGVNDAPQVVVAGPMQLDEGGTRGLDASLLRAVDPDHLAADLRWVLQSAPTVGSLRLDGVALRAGDAFSQADVDAGRLSYVHDGSERFADAIELALDDGVAPPQAVRMQVDIRPVDDQAPVIVGPAVFDRLENGTDVATLAATDADLPASTLAWRIAGGADAARFTIDAATGALRFVAAPDFEQPGDADGDNVYQLTVEVGDGQARRPARSAGARAGRERTLHRHRRCPARH